MCSGEKRQNFHLDYVPGAKASFSGLIPLGAKRKLYVVEDEDVLRTCVAMPHWVVEGSMLIWQNKYHAGAESKELNAALHFYVVDEAEVVPTDEEGNLLVGIASVMPKIKILGEEAEYSSGSEYWYDKSSMLRREYEGYKNGVWWNDDEIAIMQKIIKDTKDSDVQIVIPTVAQKIRSAKSLKGRGATSILKSLGLKEGEEFVKEGRIWM